MSWKQDKVAIFVLTVLYCLQGIPLGLVFGSLPFILGERLSFSDQATFSLAVYPYSLKIFWSPIVDAIYSSKWGRRKTWIFPLQNLMGITMIYISFNINEWMGSSHLIFDSPNDNITNQHIEHESPRVWYMTYWFFFLVFLTATQDIAVDGWALTMLKQENRHFQSTCQSFGQTLGYSLAFPVFLALSSSEICQKYLRTQDALVNIESFLMLCGIILIIINILVTIFVHERTPTKIEQDELDNLSIKSAYIDMLSVIRVPHVIKLCFFLITCKIAFACVDSASNLKMQKAGFPKETAGMLVFTYVPFDLLSPLLVTYLQQHILKLSSMKTWKLGYILRIIVSSFIIYIVYSFNGPNDLTFKFLLSNVIIVILYSFTCNMMFTSTCAFFAGIADSSIGGTYLTLLNTLSNLGGTFPRYFVLKSIDYFTILDKENDFYQCLDESHATSKEYYYDSEDEKCYKIIRDGYYVTCTICAVFGIIWIIGMNSIVNHLDQIPVSKWKVPRKNNQLKKHDSENENENENENERLISETPKNK